MPQTQKKPSKIFTPREIRGIELFYNLKLLTQIFSFEKCLGEYIYDFKKGHTSPKYRASLKVEENSGEVPSTLAGVEQFQLLVHTSSVSANDLNSLIVN